MRKFKYTLVDVFTNAPFGGNQLAVFEDAEGLTGEVMQVIANELNLSETAFVFSAYSPTKTKKVRIFTPKMELPMAGHPTIGTAHVLAVSGLISTLEGSNEWIFEEGVGDVPLTVNKENNLITKCEMKQPLPQFGEKLIDIDIVAQLLSLSVDDIDTTYPVQTVSSGVPFLFIPIRTLRAMEKMSFRTDVWQKYFRENLNRQHIFTFTTETVEQSSHVHSRMFAPAMGITEDPATGGASGPLGAYLIEYGVIPSEDNGVIKIQGEQGFEMGRKSFIEITIVKADRKIQQIKVGGQSVIIGKGEIQI